MKLTKQVLYRSAKPVGFLHPETNQQIAQDMLALMRAKGGIGLAATQCGMSLRLFVMEIDNQSRQCFNPVVEQASLDNCAFTEGCLSFPGKQYTIYRPAQIKVKYQDYRGDWHHERLAGIEARCFQHELDHLDGITMQKRHKEQNAEQS